MPIAAHLRLYTALFIIRPFHIATSEEIASRHARFRMATFLTIMLRGFFASMIFLRHFLLSLIRCLPRRL